MVKLPRKREQFAELHESDARGSSAAVVSETVLNEYVRLDKIIRDCEHTLLTAERLKMFGRTIPEVITELVKNKLQDALTERKFLDDWMIRLGKSTNTCVSDGPVDAHESACSAEGLFTARNG